MSQTREFLDALFGEKPERAAVQIWHRGKRSVTWNVADLDLAERKSLDGADKHDVYVACGLAGEASDRALPSRAKAADVCGIPGVWADLDVNGGPDAKAGAAPDREAAVALAMDLLEPTLVVNSGYGVQAWWLREDGPWMFPTRTEQEQAKRIVAGFQGALRAAARRAGWGLDATQDLARVMRIPGTFNHKGETPVPVELMDHGGKRYDMTEIASLGQGFMTLVEGEAKGLESGDGVLIDIDPTRRPDARVFELLHEEPDFRALWEMKRRSGRPKAGEDSSPSSYELGICNWLVRAGLSEQEIADAIVYWRNKIEPGDPRRRIRRERIARTIGKAMRSVQVEDDEGFVQATQDEAVQTLTDVARSPGAASEAKALAAFNQIIGGPEIARIWQNSRDPLRARISIELADGRKVPLGGLDTLLRQDLFRKAYVALTQHYPMSVKREKWEKALAGLVKVIVVEDHLEDSRVGEMLGCVADYVGTMASSDKDGSCESAAPFTESDKVYLSMGHFIRWMRRVLGERVELADVKLILNVAGFERTTVHYTRADGSRSTRSYYFGGLREVERAA